MYETSKVLDVIIAFLKQNKLIAVILLVAMALPLTSAMTETVSPTKYASPSTGDSITFYSDGRFFIDQDNDLDGTYIETPESYGITFTTTKGGMTVKKVSNGIEVPIDDYNVEIWNKV